MRRSKLATLAALLTLTLVIFACAPSSSMVATLTMLPATVTPARPTPVRTATSNLKVTPSQAVSPVDTPLPCPPAGLDTNKPLPSDPDGFIGRSYDLTQLPKSITLERYGLLQSNDFSWASLDLNGQKMMWVQKLVCRTSSGKPYWQVVDALLLPKADPTKNEAIADLCFQGDQQVPFPIAYGTYDPSKSAETINNFSGWPMVISRAWQMEEQFIPLDTTGLSCIVQDQGVH